MIHKILNTNKVLLKDRGEKIAYLGVVRGFDDLDSALKQLNKNEYVKDIEVIGKFINFDLKWEKILKDFDLKTQEKKNKKIILEHTSVNPNAPPHVGRTRNAIIGSTLEKVFKYNGYDVEVQYYVNDIGKQVAILVYGVKDKNLDELTPEDLLKIYIETNKNLDEEKEKEVIELLEKFESGDERTKELFRKVVEKALKLQINIFGKLNVKYDKFIYESDFLKDCENILEDIKKLDCVVVENGSIQFKFDDIEKNLVLTRENGVSLYPLRDIAYHIYKLKFGVDCYGVYGADHRLHFEQLKRVLKKLGHNSNKLHFIFYEYVLLPEGKMSTRKGNVILVTDFMEKVKEKVLKELEKRGKEKDEKLAEKMAVACVRYSIGKIDPNKKVIFDVNRETKLDGDTGVYIQYSYVRLKKILSQVDNFDPNYESKELNEYEKDLVKEIYKFEDILNDSLNKPHLPYNYLRSLSDKFNKFYEFCRVLDEKDKDIKNQRINILKKLLFVYDIMFDICGIPKVDEI